MVYTFLISVVFIAELIIMVAILQNLVKLDKSILDLNDTLTTTKPGIKDVSMLLRKISEQWVILSQDFVDRARENGEEILIKQISKLLMGILVLNLNFKIVKRIRKSKITKFLAKGYSLVESMI